jgi:hypothetical protein
MAKKVDVIELDNVLLNKPSSFGLLPKVEGARKIKLNAIEEEL